MISEDHNALHRRQASHEPAGERDKGSINEQHPGTGVLEDVKELLLEETGIDRVQDGADTRDAVEQFEMPVAVHRERGDAVAAYYARLQQRAGELASAGPGLAVGVPVRSPFLVARHDLAVRVVFLSVTDEGADHQLPVLHQPKNFTHRRLPCMCLHICVRDSSARCLTIPEMAA